jgi:Zinc-binding dehydrogenase
VDAWWPSFDVENLLAGVSCILGSTVHGSRREGFFSGNPRHELFAELTRYAQKSDIRPVVGTIHPFARIAAAHRALEAGGVRGKHVIQVVLLVDIAQNSDRALAARALSGGRWPRRCANAAR